MDSPHNSVYMEFAHRLASLRKERGLSQMELAAKLHMPQSTYAGYETGKRKITLELILQFSHFYSVSPTFLVTGQEHFDSDMTISLSEIDLIKKYRALSERGKEAVDMILNQPKKSVIVVVKPEESNTA
jgi:transcriptional regulator with XRE-family HTH domain